MRNYFYLLTLLLLDFSISELTDEKYEKLTAVHIKTMMVKPNIYIIDTRDNTISNKGYLPNSLILPLAMSYSTWFPAVVKEGSNVVLISDEQNYKKAIEQTVALGPYNILGYALYDELIQEASFSIQVAEYNENTKEDVEKLVKNGEYLLDIREVSEYKETGVIENSHLIPLSTFKTEYSKIPDDVDVYVFCKGGGRALLGMSYAKRAGYKNRFVIMRGGMSKTIKEGFVLTPYSE